MTRWPIIFFQVNSSDSWGRNKVEAYGFCEIPKTPGYQEIIVKTWKPKETIQDEINSFYLGFKFIYFSLFLLNFFFRWIY